MFFFKMTRIVVLAILLFILIPLTSCSRNIRDDYIPFSHYPVQGLDVSHHQGAIDWKMVGQGRFSFVYIKATEGAGHVDSRFAYNYKNAMKYGFLVGAYHYFSLSKTGKEQAENFITTVPARAGMLPPVIDLEYMGMSRISGSGEKLKKELGHFIKAIEGHYGCRPILYSNKAFYKRYLAGSFMEYSVWIADYMSEPELPDNRMWLFWQYSDRGRVKGIRGHVDFNVYNGDRGSLMAMAGQ